MAWDKRWAGLAAGCTLLGIGAGAVIWAMTAFASQGDFAAHVTQSEATHAAQWRKTSEHEAQLRALEALQKSTHEDFEYQRELLERVADKVRADRGDMRAPRHQ